MTKKEKDTLKDMQAFLEFSIANDSSYKNTLSILDHDIDGLLYEEDEYFSPRTSGYFRPHICEMKDCSNETEDHRAFCRQCVNEKLS